MLPSRVFSGWNPMPHTGSARFSTIFKGLDRRDARISSAVSAPRMLEGAHRLDVARAAVAVFGRLRWQSSVFLDVVFNPGGICRVGRSARFGRHGLTCLRLRQ